MEYAYYYNYLFDYYSYHMHIDLNCYHQNFLINLLIFEKIYDILKVRKRFRIKGVFPWYL